MKNNMDWGKTQHGTAKLVRDFDKNKIQNRQAEEITKV